MFVRGGIAYGELRASACGASYKSLVKEVILEIGAICLGGCVIGMGAGTIESRIPLPMLPQQVFQWA